MPKSVETQEDIQSKRDANANPGFFLRGAVWLLSRFPGTKNAYQNWTPSRRILVGWLLWLICLPIIPAVAIGIWYFHDPEGFKKSPYAKLLIGVFVVWLGAFGVVATNPSQVDANGKYSPIQTVANGETKGSVTDKPKSAASEISKQKVASQTESKPTNGRTFDNCSDAFDAGVFNIKRSDKSYDNSLDRDDDGIACEK
jgi:Excalibur calcium-binding domain